MKIIPALFFVAVGIWVTYTYPDVAKQGYSYIVVGVNWALAMLNDLRGA